MGVFKGFVAEFGTVWKYVERTVRLGCRVWANVNSLRLQPASTAYDIQGAGFELQEGEAQKRKGTMPMIQVLGLGMMS